MNSENSSIRLSDENIFTEYVQRFNAMDLGYLRHLELPLEMNVDSIKKKQLRNIFERCKNLEYVVFKYDVNVLTLLPMLDELQKLDIHNVPYDCEAKRILPSELRKLHKLSKLSIKIEYEENGVKILRAISNIKTIKELRIHMTCDAVSIRDIKAFRALEILHMGPLKCCCNISAEDFKGFSNTLKYIKMEGIHINIDHFLDAIRPLQSLETFDLGEGDIFTRDDQCKFLTEM